MIRVVFVKSIVGVVVIDLLLGCSISKQQTRLDSCHSRFDFAQLTPVESLQVSEHQLTFTLWSVNSALTGRDVGNEVCSIWF